MAWYKGGIPAAIAETKESGKMLVVYVTGKDCESRRMNRVWQDREVKALCQIECVCLKLRENSTACRQFAEIYPILTIPSTFFIAYSGLPRDIITGFITAESLIKKINKTLQTRSIPSSTDASKPLPTKSPPVPVLTQTSDSEPTEPSTTDQTSSIGIKLTVSSRPEYSPTSTESALCPSAMVTSYESSSVGYSDDDDESSTLLASTEYDMTSKGAGSSLPTCVMELKRLAAAQLQKRMNHIKLRRLNRADEESRMLEVRKKNMIQKLKEEKEREKEMERILTLEERRMEKQRKSDALKAVKAEIARDRVERQRKQEEEEKAKKIENELRKQEQKLLKKLKKDDDEKMRQLAKLIRIQYRFPDGTVLSRRYPPDTNLRSCIDDLIESAEPKKLPKAFQLCTAAPPCVFDTDDEDQTLASLGLVPNASIFVQAKETPVITGSQKGILGKILAFLLYLFTLPFKLFLKLWNFITGSPPLRSRSIPPEDAFEPPEHSVTSETLAGTRSLSSLRRRELTTSRETVRQLYGLHDISSDDESPTWNPDSAEQT